MQEIKAKIKPTRARRGLNNDIARTGKVSLPEGGTWFFGKNKDPRALFHNILDIQCVSWKPFHKIFMLID